MLLDEGRAGPASSELLAFSPFFGACTVGITSSLLKLFSPPVASQPEVSSVLTSSVFWLRHRLLSLELYLHRIMLNLHCLLLPR